MTLKAYIKVNATLRLFAYLTVVVFLFVSCGRDDGLEKEIRRLSQQTMPPNSKMIRAIDIERKSFSVNTFWELEIGEQWKEYINWLNMNLQGTYKMANADESRATFKRSL